MKTVILGPPPPEIEAVIARRRALGQDTHDEIWQGEYHMAPAPHQWHGYLVAQLHDALKPLAAAAGLVRLDAFNLGAADDYRVPDMGLVRQLGADVYVPTAVMVVEVVSPGDESREKFGFYAGRGVDEVLIADPARRELSLFALAADRYRPTQHSAVLDTPVASIAAAITWPS